MRVIDIRDRLTAEQDQHDEEIRAVARLLWKAGFDAYEVPMFLSPCGDLEIHERRARAGDRQHRHHTAGVTNTVTTRTSADITPFRAAIAAGAHVLMVSSAYYSRIDPAYPAVFSPTVIRGMIHSDLGFGGIVVSDDLGNARQVAAWSYGAPPSTS